MVGMKDIDFDELDRAVNSMISNQSSSATDTSSVVVNTTVGQSSPVATQNVVQRPPAPRLNNGRFMDMVRSNVNQDINKTPLSMPSRPSSQPIANPVSVVDSQPKPSFVVTPVPPNPIKTSVVADEDSDIDQITEDIEATLNQINTPQESPFLSGAKVEKRPLNALVEESNAQESKAVEAKINPVPILTNDDLNKDVIKNHDSLTDEKEKFNQLNIPLPAELQSDILSVESNEGLLVSLHDNVSLDDKDEKPEVLNQNIIVKPESVQPTTVPVVPTSIQQQYVEKPNTEEKVNVSIYDTNSYHKAMDGNKKKSNLMFIVWLVLLIILSIGAGVAVYFFVLPNL